MLKVYVSGPYSHGDTCINVRTAIHAADKLVELGFCPFVPHLTHLWHMISPKEYDFWIKYDLQWLEDCDFFLRLPGESGGADREEARARELGMPVYHGLEAFVDFMTTPFVLA